MGHVRRIGGDGAPPRGSNRRGGRRGRTVDAKPAEVDPFAAFAWYHSVFGIVVLWLAHPSPVTSAE